MAKIRIGIVGYGNLGRGVQLALSQNADMELVAIFTRRAPASVQPIFQTVVEPLSELDAYRDQIDVLILCGGSATDLPVQGPEMLARFNTVDSFDTHAKIPEYLAAMEETGKSSGKLGAISIGWDPGLFSMSRMMFEALVPKGCGYTFWGKGVSQGHSDAIRRIEGVLNAVQYTVPVPSAMERVRKGENPDLTARQKHTRECYVAAASGADLKRIESEIVHMPNYFSDYDTTVHFVTEEELKKNHAAMPHGGYVLRSGESAEGSRFLLELSIMLESNPEFTSGILVAYARAVYRLHRGGVSGAVTAFDVPIGLLSPLSREELAARLL